MDYYPGSIYRNSHHFIALKGTCVEFRVLRKMINRLGFKVEWTLDPMAFVPMLDYRTSRSKKPEPHSRARRDHYLFREDHKFVIRFFDNDLNMLSPKLKYVKDLLIIAKLQS
jgi:hypothetical protein